MTINKRTITTYTIDDHPNPTAVYDWVRSNCHDLSENCISEHYDSIAEFCAFFNITLDRNNNINAPDLYNDLSGVRAWKYLQNNGYFDDKILSGNCPFTGVCFDETLLDAIRDFKKHPEDITITALLTRCLSRIYQSIGDEQEYIYSNEAIEDILLVNENEFTVSGELWR